MMIGLNERWNKFKPRIKLKHNIDTALAMFATCFQILHGKIYLKNTEIKDQT